MIAVTGCGGSSSTSTNESETIIANYGIYGVPNESERLHYQENRLWAFYTEPDRIL